MCATGHTRRFGHALLCGPDHGHYGAHLGAKESGMSTARPDPSASHLRWLLLLVAMITITFVVTRCCGPASQPILDPQGQPAAPPTDAGHTLQAATTPAVPTETIERSLAAAPPPAAERTMPPLAAPEDDAPRVPAGATLFERMKHLSRIEGGKDKADDEDDGDDSSFPSIPRFLGRQSNQ